MYQAKNRQKITRVARNIYNNKCQNCNIDIPALLQWHHRGGNQGKKREETLKLCRRIAKAGHIVPGVMFLCANCHILQDLKDGTHVGKKYPGQEILKI